MSLLGKILVVIQTILALLFLGVQATLYHHANDWRDAQVKTEMRYKKIVEVRREQITKLESEKQAETTAKSDAQNALERYKGEIKALEDKNNDLVKGAKELRDDITSLQGQHTKVVSTITEKDTQISQYLSRIGQLQEDLQVATDNQELAEAQVARLIQQRAALEKDLKESRTDLSRAQQRVLDQQLVLDELQRVGVPIDIIVGNFPPAPPMRALVAGIDTSVQPAIVLLTIGKDDGVRMGHTFTVYRGDQFVGKVVVSRVMADSAGARILFQAPGQTVQQGDQAATALD